MSRLDQHTLDSIIRKAVAESDISGAAFQVQSVDKLINIQSACGNLKTNSAFYIASINKMMISAIVLKMCEQKKISLSDNIKRYFPTGYLDGILTYKGIDYTGRLTINHLIRQTSGLPCYLLDKKQDGKTNMDLFRNGEDQFWEFEKMISAIKEIKARFDPGGKTKAHYSETNFRLLGRIIEIVTGKKISILLTEMFEDLVMSSAYVLPGPSENQCAPVHYKQNSFYLNHYWMSTNHDVAGNTSDLMVFLRHFFEGYFFPMERIASLKEWNSTFFPFKYGVGIQKFYIPRILTPFKAFPEIIGHSGSVGSIAFYVPEKKVYITGTVNQANNVKIAFQILMKIIAGF